MGQYRQEIEAKKREASEAPTEAAMAGWRPGDEAMTEKVSEKWKSKESGAKSRAHPRCHALHHAGARGRSFAEPAIHAKSTSATRRSWRAGSQNPCLECAKRQHARLSGWRKVKDFVQLSWRDTSWPRAAKIREDNVLACSHRNASARRKDHCEGRLPAEEKGGIARHRISRAFSSPTMSTNSTFTTIVKATTNREKCESSAAGLRGDRRGDLVQKRPRRSLFEALHGSPVRPRLMAYLSFRFRKKSFASKSTTCARMGRRIRNRCRRRRTVTIDETGSKKRVTTVLSAPAPVPQFMAFGWHLNGVYSAKNS